MKHWSDPGTAKLPSLASASIAASRRCHLALLAVALLSAPILQAAPPPGENIARGQKVQFATSPNYSYCTDADDVRQLTDGQYTIGHFWTQKSTVGWANVAPVILTLDLGKVQPIAGLSYSTAAGVAGVSWPASIHLVVSDEGKTWRYAGDLMMLSAKQGLPAADKYSTHRFATSGLQTRGRFVRLAVVPQGGYTFCDEIEVQRGPDSLLPREPAGELVTDINAFVRRGATRAGVVWRLTADLAAARRALATAKLPDSRRQELRARLDAAEREIVGLPDPNPDSFRAILPLNETHARIASVFGPISQARGLPAFFAWKKHRYDYLTPHEVPVTAPATPALNIEMLQNEFRADAFLLSNLSEKPVTAAVRVRGLPGAPAPAWLRIAAVPWTDTSHRQPVAAALPDAECVAGEYRVPVPAGFTCKVWLTVNSTGLEPGTYRGTLVVAGAGKPVSVPFNLRVSPLKMSRPRLSLGMWDYTDGRGNYGITPTNRATAIALMRSHFVDTPWANGSVLPWPATSAFDQNHQLKAPLSFAAFDAWLQLWPGVRRYFVFPSVGETFAGARMGTPQFNARVGSWAKALSTHLRSLGLKPEQLGLLLVDEPHSDEQDERIAAWARAINAAAPELTLFQDPTWERPDRTKVQEAITLADIVCPNIPIFYRGGTNVARYFAERRAAGQTMWFYQCSGPAKLFDPYRYHRLQAWHAFQHGATGMGFWAFGDTGGALSSWNEYAAAHTPYTPAFLSTDNAVDGIHWQAVREGIEDYEYLAMLRDAAGRSKNAGWKTKANALLTEAPQAVLDGYTPVYDWKNEANRTVADTYRLRVLKLLEEMN